MWTAVSSYNVVMKHHAVMKNCGKRVYQWESNECPYTSKDTSKREITWHALVLAFSCPHLFIYDISPALILIPKRSNCRKLRLKTWFFECREYPDNPILDQFLTHNISLFLFKFSHWRNYRGMSGTVRNVILQMSGETRQSPLRF